MDTDKIEIKANRKSHLLFSALLVCSALGMTYYVFFSGRFENNSTVKYIYLVILVPLFYSNYKILKSIIRKTPALNFSKNVLEINVKGKLVPFLWMQIIEWRIEKETDSNTSNLVIKTANSTETINISWLDKKSTEIEELMHFYKPKPVLP